MPINARRRKLEHLTEEELLLNPGLYFRCGMPALPVKGDSSESGLKKAHLEAVARIKHSPDYKFYFEQLWTPMVNTPSFPGQVIKVVRLKTSQRLITGLKESSVVENAVAFDRIYGVPLLRGSGWKGLTRRVAWHRLSQNEPKWNKGGDFDRFLFGGPDAQGNDEKGAVDFGDALPVPGQWKLMVDNLTSQGETLWDKPNPVNFFSLEGLFDVPLRGVSGWVERAAEMLVEAARSEGFGAKTSSGFGRMNAS